MVVRGRGGGGRAGGGLGGWLAASPDPQRRAHLLIAARTPQGPAEDALGPALTRHLPCKIGRNHPRYADRLIGSNEMKLFDNWPGMYALP